MSEFDAFSLTTIDQAKGWLKRGVHGAAVLWQSQTGRVREWFLRCDHDQKKDRCDLLDVVEEWLEGVGRCFWVEAVDVPWVAHGSTRNGTFATSHDEIPHVVHGSTHYSLPVQDRTLERLSC